MFVSYTGAVNGIQEVWTNRQTIGGNLLLNALGLGPGFVSLVPMALMKIMLMSSAMMIRHLHKSQTVLLFLSLPVALSVLLGLSLIATNYPHHAAAQ